MTNFLSALRCKVSAFDEVSPHKKTLAHLLSIFNVAHNPTEPNNLRSFLFQTNCWIILANRLFPTWQHFLFFFFYQTRRINIVNSPFNTRGFFVVFESFLKLFFSREILPPGGFRCEWMETVCYFTPVGLLHAVFLWIQFPSIGNPPHSTFLDHPFRLVF